MIVEFEEALRIVAAEAARLPLQATEEVALLDSVGRVLAGGVQADRDQPPFDRATRDGFAVQAAATEGSDPLRVIGEVQAGRLWRGAPVTRDSAVRIMTGAPLPLGADSVLMVEHAEILRDRLRPVPGRALQSGDNVVRRGSEAHSGDEVLAGGTPIGAAEIALLATCGLASVAVFKQPAVAIVSTGDELVDVAEMPGPEQIRNSNSYALAALVALAGARPVRLATAPDLREPIRERVEQARAEATLLVFSGGVSMGEYDLLEEILAAAGAEFCFTGVKMQPGKPVVFGRLPAQGASPPAWFFGLPGNPISAQVTFSCFAEPLLRVLGGEQDCAPKWAQATLADAVESKAGITRLLPARRDGVEVRVVGWQGSGDLAANARANCYAEFEPGRSYRGGETIRVLLR